MYTRLLLLINTADGLRQYGTGWLDEGEPIENSIWVELPASFFYFVCAHFFFFLIFIYLFFLIILQASTKTIHHHTAQPAVRYAQHKLSRLHRHRRRPSADPSTSILHCSRLLFVSLSCWKMIFLFFSLSSYPMREEAGRESYWSRTKSNQTNNGNKNNNNNNNKKRSQCNDEDVLPNFFFLDFPAISFCHPLFELLFDETKSFSSDRTHQSIANNILISSLPKGKGLPSKWVAGHCGRRMCTWEFAVKQNSDDLNEITTWKYHPANFLWMRQLWKTPKTTGRAVPAPSEAGIRSSIDCSC